MLSHPLAKQYSIVLLGRVPPRHNIYIKFSTIDFISTVAEVLSHSLEKRYLIVFLGRVPPRHNVYIKFSTIVLASTVAECSAPSRKTILNRFSRQSATQTYIFYYAEKIFTRPICIIDDIHSLRKPFRFLPAGQS